MKFGIMVVGARELTEGIIHIQGIYQKDGMEWIAVQEKIEGLEKTEDKNRES